MPHTKIHLDGDGCWPDLLGKVGTETVIETEWESISCLPNGMSSGKPSVMLRLNLPDGRVVLSQTSLQMLLTIADAFKGRFGDPRT
jgi:hypothetical protein